MRTPPIEAVEIIGGDKGAAGLHNDDAPFVDPFQNGALERPEFSQKSAQGFAVQDKPIVVIFSELENEVDEVAGNSTLGHAGLHVLGGGVGGGVLHDGRYTPKIPMRQQKVSTY
jgi:hypothetical protein